MASVNGVKKTSKDDYVLTRDASASARLNLSHYVWQASFGFSLNPRIATSIAGKDDLKIADVGTGTGIWLFDVAAQLPRTAQLDAIDIDLSQCPPKEWLPKNVTLKQLDVFGELSDEYIGRYDVVHLRHFVCVVAGNDPMPLLKNLIKMLKPGGWLQWDEWDTLNRNFTVANADVPTDAIIALETELAAMRRHTNKPEWMPRLDDIFLSADMENVAIEKRKSSPSLLPCMHDLTLLVFQELVDKATSSDSVDTEKAQDLRRLLKEAMRQSRVGAAWNLTRIMAIGQKSLE